MYISEIVIFQNCLKTIITQLNYFEFLFIHYLSQTNISMNSLSIYISLYQKKVLLHIFGKI